jgi:hypothetical protein
MEEKDAQVIIALSFGQGINNTPGKSNEVLAQIVADFENKYALPIVAQWEIADCIPERIQDVMSFVVREHRQKGQYLDTFEVLAQAKEYCDKFGFRKAIIVAHPDHMPRCVAVAKKIGFDVAIADTKKVPYDPESTQEWARSAEAFLSREEKAVEYYRQKGCL